MANKGTVGELLIKMSADLGQLKLDVRRRLKAHLSQASPRSSEMPYPLAAPSPRLSASASPLALWLVFFKQLVAW
jgi:hypothetical protein